MSKYKGNSEECPGCSLTYGEFHTGMTFREVKHMLFDNHKDPKKWKYKRRGTVLGFWHQMKKELWAHHAEGCYRPDLGDVTVDRSGMEVPF